MKTKITLGILFILASACSKYNIEKGRSPLSDPDHFEAGPGTVLIDSNFYTDQTEITNFNWLEYMYWKQKVFGNKSPEHIASFPDTTVWGQYHVSLTPYEHAYLRHPAYRDYPVVGISQSQASDYAKWRSDRVFEFILIREGVIDYTPGQTRDTYFSVEKYFAGNYQGKTPHPNVKYFPQYELPSYLEWRQSLSHFEDLNQESISKHCTKLTSPIPHINSVELNQPDSLDRIIDPLFPNGVSCHKKVFYDMLRGNVAEWSKEPNITLGGGWTDSLSTILNNDMQHQNSPSVQTGTRYVMRWVKRSASN